MGEFHSLDLNPDEDGWWWAVCACGWQEGPFDAPDDGMDSYGDHRADDVIGRPGATPPGGGE